jgi:anti-sigma regulatory factor (Ser/Thr protein kinase)
MPEPFRLVHRPSEPSAQGWYPEVVELEMPSDVTVVATAVEEVVQRCFSGVAPCLRTVFCFRVALAEALANAILRGNRADRAKLVRVRAELRADTIRVGVEDEGEGFDPGAVRDLPFPDALDAERGRGLTIIRHLALQVEFNPRGNTIWMTLPRC